MIRVEPRKRKTPEISIAPLVDCVLLLLIFFLLTSAFSEKLGIKISLPGSESARVEEMDVLQVIISESGEITFQGRSLSLQELTDVLIVEIASHGKSPVFMLADRQVRLERVTDVIDSVRAAGVDAVSIAAQKKQD